VIDFRPRPPGAPARQPDAGGHRRLTEDSVDPRKSSSGLHARLTTVGSLFGTRSTWRPSSTRKLELDARADQFAFCVSLYEALYGELPFKAIRTSSCLSRREGKIDPARQPDIRSGWSTRCCGAQAARRRSVPDMSDLLDALQPPPARKRLWNSGWARRDRGSRRDADRRAAARLARPNEPAWCRAGCLAPGIWIRRPRTR